MFSSNRQRQSVPKKTVVYGAFRGVDFSIDPSLVDKYRSPYAPNLISDTGGMPEKRLGWRTLHKVESPINGIYHTEIDNKEYFLIHGGTKLYQVVNDEDIKDAEQDTEPETEEAEIEGTEGEEQEGAEEEREIEEETASEDIPKNIIVLREGIANHRSSAFFSTAEDKRYLFILTGSEIMCFDGMEVKDIEDIAYVPTIFVNTEPKGGGIMFDAVNLIGKQRKEDFFGNNTDRIYNLSTDNLESIDKVEVAEGSGENRTLKEGADYTVNLKEGKITFTKTYPPIVGGHDNVFITYTKVNEGKDKILNCTVATTFGGSGNATVFLSGNPEYKSRIWFSDTRKPNYFPDVNYKIAGSEENQVMGFQKLGRYLTVIKDDNTQDSTIFQMWGTEDNRGALNYQMEQGISGVGAISSNCFATLMDEPLFLSRQGILATYTTNVLAEKTLKNRSYFVDAKLTKENNLKEACATVWSGYYLLAVNNSCYVLDSRNKTYRHNQTDGNGDYIYESYHWDNFPARCFLTVADELYFGTEDGRVCKLNTDISGNERFNDDNNAVIAAWSTKNDDDGASYLYKTMQKKGCSVTIKPYSKSSCTIYYSKDGNPDTFVRKHLMDIFDWNNMDFERFTFNTNESPQDVYLKKKVKKYKRLQLIIINDGKNEGFGILQIAKTFTTGNYAKK